MQIVTSTPLLALADGVSLPVIVVVAVIVVAVVGFLALRRRALPPGDARESLPPGEAKEPADAARPSTDPLAERKVVDGPVEITDGMSLKEIREAKRARLTDKYKATEGLAEKERRKGRATGKTTLEGEAISPPEEEPDAAPSSGEDEEAPGTSADGQPAADPALDTASTAPIAKPAAPAAKPWDDDDDDDGGWDDVAEAVEVALSGAHVAVPEDEPSAKPAESGAAEAATSAASAEVAVEGEAGEEAAATEAEVDAPEPTAETEEPKEPEGTTEPAVAADEAEERAAGGAGEVEPAEESTSAVGEGAEPAEVQVDIAGTKTLREGLDRTRGGFVSRLGELFRSRPVVDDDLLEEVEEVLFTADIGSRTGQRLLAVVTEQIESGVSPDEIWGVIRREALKILEDDGDGFVVPEGEGPFVVLVVGVNGVGKTTTIGKLAARLRSEGKSVMMVAGDTFRAAAVGQLREWSERVGCGFHSGAEGADPSGVVFDGIRKAVEEGVDVVLCDTAGRLHTKQPLIDELKKVSRVCGKAMDGAPQETLLVLDANTGQNAIQQARLFGEAADVTGIVLTKLDGTAKGGVVLGIRQELGVPVYFIGIGEAVGDLRPFDAPEFVDALF